MDLQSLKDIQQLFGNSPLSAVNSKLPIQPNTNSKLKTGLWIAAGGVTLVGLYTIFNFFNNLKNEGMPKSKDLKEMRDWVDKKRQEEEESEG